MSAYPTAGGIYYWASTLGGPGWGWFTGWFNLVGLVGVVASVDYGAAQFLNATFGLYGAQPRVRELRRHRARAVGDVPAVRGDPARSHALINIFSSPLVALFNNISVFWHVAGVRGDRAHPRVRPGPPPERRLRVHRHDQQLGFGDGMFWFYVLPLGFLLTMYTQTGYDASAHISEETTGAAEAAAKGVWRSVFWSGVFGWIVLLAITFAATDVNGINDGGGSSLAVFSTALLRRLGQGRRAHRDDRPAVLRHGVRDELLAHDVRVLARPRDAGLAHLDAAEPPPRARATRCSSPASPRW